MPEIIVAKNIGFCNGVKNSLKIINEALVKYKNVTLLHPLIHNDFVMNNLLQNGVKLKKLDEIENGEVIVINAHGESPDVLKILKEKNCVIVDATCPFVKDIHKKVEKYNNDDYEIIVFGDPNHAEIKALKGYAKKIQIVQSVEDIDFDKNDKFVVMSQTTFDVELYYKYLKLLKNNNIISKKIVVFLDTICYTTLERQSEVISIAKKVNQMIIVGDKKSANTLRLYEISKNYCKNSYLISNISDLKSVCIENNTISGLISGASVPNELIMEVLRTMEETKKEEVVEVATQETTKEAQKESMADLINKYQPKAIKEGKRVSVKVMSADVDGIHVSINNAAKNDSGFIPANEVELDRSYDPSKFNPGDELECLVIEKKDSKSKEIWLSRRKIEERKVDDEKVKKILAGEEFTLSNFQVVKGGLVSHIGSYTVFVPSSQIRIGFVSKLEDYVNKTLRLVVLPPKDDEKKSNPKRIVASRRVILEKEKAQKDEEFWSKIYEGAKVTGKVKRYTDFGVFVSLDYIDGLVHQSDISWTQKKVFDPSKYLEINKKYEFIVLAADRTNEKISLGYKQLQKKPYEICEEKYPVGTVVTGKVSRLTEFGAFVEIEPGIDGLVHVSQIKNGFVQHPSDVLKEGEEVQVKIKSYDNEKITLTIKELLPAEPVEVAEEVAEAAPAKGKKGKNATPKEEPEIREYTESGSTSTLGDLFANLKTDKD